MMRSRMLRLGQAATIAVVIVLTLTACVYDAGGPVWRDRPAGSGCVPAPMTVTPETAAPGETVTISAPPAGCDLDLEPGTEFELALLTEPRIEPLPETTATLEDDGSFTTTLTIPADYPTGPAWIFLRNDDVIDWCPGYSMPQAASSVVEASCAAYEAYLTVTER